jgi:hypothetical protein
LCSLAPTSHQEVKAMKCIRIHKPRVRGGRPWQEVLPLDPRDPEIVRAKTLAIGGHDHVGGSPRREREP